MASDKDLRHRRARRRIQEMLRGLIGHRRAEEIEEAWLVRRADGERVAERHSRLEAAESEAAR